MRYRVEHYTQFIQKNPEWELAGIFADDGISGCNTKKRSEFIRMIEECMAGMIDMIITKSISRFARNTLDCLKYIRELKEKNIPVFFEKENINTMDSKGEVQVNHNRFLGYTKDEDGHLIIEPTEAEVVKRIYREYLEGDSLLQIGRGLEADGILTAVGKAKWHPETQRKKRVYSSKYALSSIVYCPKCGDIYRRIAWNNRGKHSIVWRCCTRVEHGPEKCDAPTIQESELQAAVIQDINQTLGDKDSVITALQENVETVILQEDESSAENIEARLEALQKELLKLANFKKDYNGIADEIHRLRELKQNALAKSAEREGLKKRIAEMREFLDSQPTEVLEYDEQLVRRLIEKVTVYDERFEVEFKSGMTVDEER